MKASTLLLFSSASLGLGQSLCSQYAYLAEDGWYFNNNEWGASKGNGTQCTYIDSVNSGGVSWHTDWDWSGNSGSVKAYPYSGRSLTTKKFVSNISSIPTVAEWSYQGSNLHCNIAYDLFTSADPNHATSSGDYELMIWIGNLGPVYPIGGAAIATVTINGQLWDLHIGPNGAMKVYTFVAQDQTNSFHADIKPFFTYLADHQDFPHTSQYLLTLQFGSEAFTGDDARFIVGHWDGHTS